MTVEELRESLKTAEDVDEIIWTANRAITLLELLRIERDAARYNARILAHSYEHDTRPPSRVVATSLDYPITPEN